MRTRKAAGRRWQRPCNSIVTVDAIELHSWNVTRAEAIEIQKRLRSRIRIEKPPHPIRFVAGADISFERFSDVFHAGFVIIDLETLGVVESVEAVAQAPMPYIPGLLTFREGPALLKAWRKLKVEPDAVMFDGQGIAHPRGLGIASHMGLLIDRPTIGCAKRLLTGRYEHLGPMTGSIAPLMHLGRVVGAAVRTRANVQPVYISSGHKMDLETAISVTLRSVSRYRIPEPTRQAHIWVTESRVAARLAS
jgi:deoxyribonuclease V